MALNGFGRKVFIRISSKCLVLHFDIDNHDDVICNIAIFADNTSFYRKCDQASNLWQQQELPAELESNL